MKKLLLAFCFLITGITGFAQNWSLVMPNDTLVYEKQSNHQFFTIWVDSSRVSGADTIYYLNRMAVGDNIGPDTNNLGLNCGYNYFGFDLHRNEKAQFLGDSIVNGSSGVRCLGKGNQFLWYPNAQVGDTWYADSIKQWQLEVISQKWEYLEGYETYDSIKEVSYRNEVLKISKHHGIITGIDINGLHDNYQLIGVQNLGLGETVPMTLDIYDFEVGDVFSWDNTEGHAPWVRQYKSKLEVTGKWQIGNDTVIYAFAQPGIPNKMYKRGEGEFLSAFPNTLAYHGGSFCYGLTDSIPYLVYVGRNSNGEIVKTNGLPFDTDTSSWASNCDYAYQYCWNDSAKVFSKEFEYQKAITFIKGKGLVKEGFRGLSFCNSTMIGYVKNGDTIGEISGQEELLVESKISLYPNPVHNELHIEAETNQPLQIGVYNTVGQLLLEKEMIQETIIDVQRWKNSLILVVIRNQEGQVILRKKVSVL